MRFARKYQYVARKLAKSHWELRVSITNHDVFSAVISVDCDIISQLKHENQIA